MTYGISDNQFDIYDNLFEILLQNGEKIILDNYYSYPIPQL